MPPAEQGGGGATASGASAYCAVCGRPAARHRAGETFCSEAHAEEFAREVAAVSARQREA